MGNIFYRGVCPSVIGDMGYRELKYWNDWHERMVKAEKQAVQK